MKLTGRRIAVPGIVFALLVLLIFYGGTVIGRISGNWKSGVTMEEYGRLLQEPPLEKNRSNQQLH